MSAISIMVQFPPLSYFSFCLVDFIDFSFFHLPHHSPLHPCFLFTNFSYAFAHLLEMNAQRDGDLPPNPYARLNELTFELLSGELRSNLSVDIEEAKRWSERRLANDPEKNVWLKIQIVDADFLLGLLQLADKKISNKTTGKLTRHLLSSYFNVLIAHGSPRVWSSVIDQLEFIAEMLHSLREEEDKNGAHVVGYIFYNNV